MKINSIQQHYNNKNNNQKNTSQVGFRGKDGKGVKFIADMVTKHPDKLAAIAGASAITQKVVMWAGEATVAPALDIGIGKVLTKVTGEKDGTINRNSKAQACRTFSQTTGGSIVGVIVRAVCIAATTALVGKSITKAGEKLGTEAASKFANLVAETGKGTKEYFGKNEKNAYLMAENAEAWGKSIGGVVAQGVMLFTNFIFDLPLINYINEKVTKATDDIAQKKQQKKALNNSKEVA